MPGAAAVRVLAVRGEERGGTVKTSKWLLAAELAGRPVVLDAVRATAR
jgi:hypothetical protein